ncbi:hypothetical protein C8F01DRAFT_546841 [Mycena amicta]|nr:hypothetical protein C8F01DRAFT_546841 [Mycena amicta]
MTAWEFSHSLIFTFMPGVRTTSLSSGDSSSVCCEHDKLLALSTYGSPRPSLPRSSVAVQPEIETKAAQGEVRVHRGWDGLRRGQIGCGFGDGRQDSSF